MNHQAICDLCGSWFEQETGNLGGRPRLRCYRCVPYRASARTAAKASRDASIGVVRRHEGVVCMLEGSYLPDAGTALEHLRAHERPI